MKEKPIIFNTKMVREILEGRKTVTRRVVKPQPKRYLSKDVRNRIPVAIWMDNEKWIKPPYQPGDVLYVRETWAQICNDREPPYYEYYADTENPLPGEWPEEEKEYTLLRWRPSIHMPREAARIFLKVTDVRAERVQDITEEDALKEGCTDDFPMDKIYCPICKGSGLSGTYDRQTLGYVDIECPHCNTAKDRFFNLWNSINAKRGYGSNTNPWVWVTEFERLEGYKC